MKYFKCLGAGKNALCCKGRALALTIEEAIKFWKTFLLMYQIQVLEFPEGFYIIGELSAHLDFNTECPFLRNELCSIYENRPNICKIFPWNFNSIYSSIIFRPKNKNIYFIRNPILGNRNFQNIIKILKKPFLDLCRRCNPETILEEKKSEYIPLENLLLNINREKLREDLKYQYNLLKHILSKFPFNELELMNIARMLQSQKEYEKSSFIVSHIINLGFLYAISLIGGIDFNKLLETQIKLFNNYDVTNQFKFLKEQYEDLYGGNVSSNELDKLFETIRYFVEKHKYPLQI